MPSGGLSGELQSRFDGIGAGGAGKLKLVSQVAWARFSASKCSMNGSKPGSLWP